MKRKTLLSIIAVTAALSVSACSAVNVQVNPGTQPAEETETSDETTADNDAEVPEETIRRFRFPSITTTVPRTGRITEISSDSI